MPSDNIEEKQEETAETPLTEESELRESAMGQDFAYKPFQTDFVNKKVVLRPSVATLDLDMNYSGGSGGAVLFKRIDTTTTDATPSVKNATFVELTGTTTITDFDDGSIGQIIFIKANGSITITHGTPIQLANGQDYDMISGDTLTLAMFDDQVWHEIARKSGNVLDNSPDSDHTVSGTMATFTTNSAMSYGQVCYIINPGRMELAQANAASTSAVVAMCTETIAQYGSGKFILQGFARDDSWSWTIGGAIYLSDTVAGGLTQTAPADTNEVIKIVGYALTATIIYFNPEQTMIVHA